MFSSISEYQKCQKYVKKYEKVNQHNVKHEFQTRQEKSLGNFKNIINVEN